MNYISKKIELFKLYLLAKKIKNQFMSLKRYKFAEYNKTLKNRFLRNVETYEFETDYVKFSTTDNLRFSIAKSYVRVMFTDYPCGTKELFSFSFLKWYSFFATVVYDYEYMPVIEDELNKISNYISDAKEYYSKLENEREQTMSENIHKALLGE